MGQKKKQQKNLAQCQPEKPRKSKRKPTEFRKVVEFVIALIYCRFPISLAQDFSVLTGNDPPTYREIRKAFDANRPVIEKLVKQSIETEKENMPEKASVCVDGSWDHRHNGKVLVYDVICLETKKIIDFCLKIKTSKNKRGNTDVSSKALEGEAFKEISLTLSKMVI